MVRYVDDAIGVSRRLCAHCVGLWIQSTHEGIPFEVEHDTLEGDTVPWLDAYVHLHRWPPVITAAEPERAWLAGLDPQPKKFRVPPWMGRRDEEALRSLLRGRLARLLQMRLGAQAVLQALRYDWEVWARSGWPPAEIARSWRRHGGGHSLSRLAVVYNVHMSALMAARGPKR